MFIHIFSEDLFSSSTSLQYERNANYYNPGCNCHNKADGGSLAASGKRGVQEPEGRLGGFGRKQDLDSGLGIDLWDGAWYRLEHRIYGLKLLPLIHTVRGLKNELLGKGFPNLSHLNTVSVVFAKSVCHLPIFPSYFSLN